MRCHTLLVLFAVMPPVALSLSSPNFPKSRISKMPPPSTDYLHIAAPRWASASNSGYGQSSTPGDAVNSAAPTAPAATAFSPPAPSSGYAEWRQQLDAPSRRSAAPFFSQGAGAGADFLHQHTSQRPAPAQHQQLPGYGQASQPAPGYDQASGPPAISPPPPQAGSYLDNLNNVPCSPIEPPQELNREQRQIDQDGQTRAPSSSSAPPSATSAPNFSQPASPSSGYTQWTQQLDAPPARSAASGSAATFFSRRPVPGASFLHYNDPKGRSE